MSGRLLLGVAAIAAAAAACGSLDATSAYDNGPGGSASPDAGTSPSPNDRGSAVSASGVVLVHAAQMPSLRLCFSNYMDQPPSPDSKAMPHANVVGVEVGSLVRIDPLTTPPGDVYVIDERRARQVVGSSDARRCKDLICKNGSTCLVENVDYAKAGTLNEALGTSSVDVLAVTGCGGQALLTAAGASSADCPQPWDSQSGNLALKTIHLQPQKVATETSIPAQVVHLAPLLEAERGDGGAALDVDFGALDGGATKVFAENPALFELGPETSLALDQTDPSVYASQGFEIALAPTDGGAKTVLARTSLAEVQDLTSPLDVPTTYYRVGSNYVFLLLGDPRIAKALADGGANPDYDARRAVHLLGVPVLDPATLDAGADGGGAASSDAGADGGGSAP